MKLRGLACETTCTSCVYQKLDGTVIISGVWRVPLYSLIVKCGMCCFFAVEKGNGEYQLSACSGDEEWQVHTGLQVHHQDPQAGQSQAGHSSQQCTPSKVSNAKNEGLLIYSILLYSLSQEERD